MPTYYTSGEFAKKAHVSIRTIRYYDQKNLLKPSTHTASGARRYTDADFAKLQQILLLKVSWIFFNRHSRNDFRIRRQATFT